MDLKKIGQYIQTKRKDLGLTQAELAEKLGMSNKSVSKWERGVCLPDVSIYTQLCDILGISLNEFIAGEDIESDKIAEKSENNILEVTRDGLRRSAKFKTIIVVLSIIVALGICTAGYYLYPVLFPRTNYIEPMDAESKEVELAKTWFGVGKAFLYNYAVDETFDNICINLSLYKEGQLIHEEKVFEYPLEDFEKEGFIAVFHDSLDKDVKIMVGSDSSSGSIVGPIFDEIEEAISGSSSEGRHTEADIEQGKAIGIGCVHFGENSITGCSPERIETGEGKALLEQNEYTYYLWVEFS